MGSSYLLTRQWLEDANRIKRRATTNGGKDQSLTIEIIQRLASTSSATQQLKELDLIDLMHHMGQAKGWQGYASDRLQKKSMSSNQDFALKWIERNIPSQQAQDDLLRDIFSQHLPHILTQFQLLPQGDWKRGLSNMVVEFIRLLNQERSIKTESALVLELVADSNLWNARCKIPA